MHLKTFEHLRIPFVSENPTPGLKATLSKDFLQDFHTKTRIFLIQKKIIGMGLQ